MAVKLRDRADVALWSTTLDSKPGWQGAHALRVRACLCNESVKNHFEEVLRGVYPTEDAVVG
jgi:hypothetical protein